jgi:raffinose/stachyose/melibiose transport system substrate-binding protein
MGRTRGIHGPGPPEIAGKESRALNRKLLSLGAALLLVGQACGGTATPSPSASAGAPASAAPPASVAPTTAPPVTLTLWHNYGTEANAAVTESLTKAYTALNPNVTINLVSQPADNYFALLKAAAIAKTGPDLLTMWTGLFALQNQGFLEPLNQYIPVDQLKKFPGINWCSKDLNVELGAICVPLDDQSYNGFYNKALFAQAGITAVPTTWTELYDACAKLKAAGIQPFAYGTGGQALNAGFYPYYDLSYMMMIFSVEDWKKLFNGQIPWTDPRIVAQLQKWADLKTKGYTNEDVLTNTESIAQFEAGQAAMTLEGSWDFKEFQDKMGDNVGVFLPPFSDQPIKGVVEFPGNGFGVTSYSQHKAEAADFLKFMLTPQAQKIIADGGLIPTIPGTPTTQRMAIDMLAYAADQGYTRYPMIDNVMQPEVVDVATRVLNAVLAGTMSPQDAAQKMQDALMSLPVERRGDTYQ